MKKITITIEDSMDAQPLYAETTIMDVNGLLDALNGCIGDGLTDTQPEDDEK